MNKKLITLLILPLLLLSVVSFGAAHLTDTVGKKYKLYVGTMSGDVVYFHVDYVKIIDKDNDGVIFGDELNVSVLEHEAGKGYEVRILVNPVSPDFVLNTTMYIQNTGEIPWRITWNPTTQYSPIWDNASTDKCWDEVPLGVGSLPTSLWTWDVQYFKDNSTRGGGIYPASPTEHYYKSGDVFIVKQCIKLKQPATLDEINAYRSIWGKWFRVWETFYMESEEPVTTSSNTYGTDVLFRPQ